MTTELKSILDTIADSVALNPAAAGVTFAADSDLVGVCEVDVRIGRHAMKVDEPAVLGGGGVAPNPVEYALMSLGSCVAITYRFWSTKLEIPFDKVTVAVRGDLDVRGVFGLEDGVRPGFGHVRLDVAVSGPGSPEHYEELRRAVDEHCPVLDIFTNSIPVKATMTVRSSAR